MADDNLNPTLVSDDDYNATVDRWQKYGHDRLYVNGFETEPYIDLDDFSLGDTGMVAIEMERDGDTVTLSRRGSDREVVISLSGDVDESADGEEDVGAEDNNDGFHRIEQTDEAPGVDTTTVEVGDVLEQLTGPQQGEQFRVEEVKQFFEEGATLVVEPLGDSRRDEITGNSSGPIFAPVEEV